MMSNQNGEKKPTWLKYGMLIIGIPAAFLASITLWHVVMPKKPPITGIVLAHNNFDIPTKISNTKDFSKFDEIKNVIFIRIQNEGEKVINDVKFDFATASYIEISKGYKGRDSHDTYQNINRLDIGILHPKDVINISMWIQNKIMGFTPEEKTDIIMKDIHIRYSEEPCLGELYSYYTEDGKKKFYKFISADGINNNQ